MFTHEGRGGPAKIPASRGAIFSAAAEAAGLSRHVCHLTSFLHFPAFNRSEDPTTVKLRTISRNTTVVRKRTTCVMLYFVIILKLFYIRSRKHGLTGRKHSFILGILFSFLHETRARLETSFLDETARFCLFRLIHSAAGLLIRFNLIESLVFPRATLAASWILK